MKNTNAFTLIELLAVLIVLAVIAMITVPIVTKKMDESERKLCVTQYQNILKAARSYGAEHNTDLGDGKTITLQDLIKEGYLDSKEIKDPVTNEKISSDFQIQIQKKSGAYSNYEYSFPDTSKTGCSDQLSQ